MNKKSEIVSLRLSSDLQKELQITSAKTGLSTTELVRLCLEMSLPVWAKNPQAARVIHALSDK